MRSHEGLYLQGRADRTGHPILTGAVFGAIHVILSLKLGDHEGLALFVHDRLLKRTLLLVLPSFLIQIPTCAFLSPVHIYWRVQSGTSWCLPGSCWRDASTHGTQLRETQPAAPNSGKLSTGFVYFISHITLITPYRALEHLYSEMARSSRHKPTNLNQHLCS